MRCPKKQTKPSSQSILACAQSYHMQFPTIPCSREPNDSCSSSSSRRKSKRTASYSVVHVDQLQPRRARSTLQLNKWSRARGNYETAVAAAVLLVNKASDLLTHLDARVILCSRVPAGIYPAPTRDFFLRTFRATRLRFFSPFLLIAFGICWSSPWLHGGIENLRENSSFGGDLFYDGKEFEKIPAE